MKRFCLLSALLGLLSISGCTTTETVSPERERNQLESLPESATTPTEIADFLMPWRKLNAEFESGLQTIKEELESSLKSASGKPPAGTISNPP